MKLKVISDLIKIKRIDLRLRRISVLYRKAGKPVRIPIAYQPANPLLTWIDQFVSPQYDHHPYAKDGDVVRMINRSLNDELLDFMNGLQRVGVQGLLIDGKAIGDIFPMRKSCFISIPLDGWLKGEFNVSVWQKIRRLIDEIPSVSAAFGPERIRIDTPLKESRVECAEDMYSQGVWFKD